MKFNHKNKLTQSSEIDLLKQRIKDLEAILENRTATDEILEKEGNKYFSYFHNAADLIAVIDKDGFFIEINNRFEKESEYGRDEILGKNLSTCGILDKSSAQLVSTYLKRVINGEILPMFEVNGLTKSGKIIPYEIRAVQIRKDNQITAVQANLRNIEERRRIEKTLDEREEHYHTLFQLSPSGLVLEDKEGNILEVNPAYCNSLGYERDELIGKNIRIIAHPDQADHIESHIKKIMAGEVLCHVVMSQRKDGSSCYMELNEKKVSLPDGTDGILCISVDISERITAEQEIKDSEKSYRELFESITDAIYLQDREGKFVMVNQGAEKMYGYSREEFVGNTPDFLSAPGRNDMKQVLNYVEKAFAGEPQIFEFWGKRKNGEIFPKEVRLCKGDYFGDEAIIAFSRDISDQKRAEEDITKKSQLQENLLNTARHLTKSLDIKEVLKQVGNGVMEILNTHSCAIYLLEPDLKILRPVVAIDPDYKEQVMSTPIDVDNSFTGQSVLAKKGLIFNNMGSNSAGHQIPGTPEELDERICVAPFLVENKVIGAMCLSRVKIPFTREELSLVETFATYASAALRNAQLYNDIHKEVVERKLTQERINELNLQYESFIKNSLIGIWKMVFEKPIPNTLPVNEIGEQIIKQGKIAECNDALAGMYGFTTSEELIGKKPGEFAADYDETVKRLIKFVENGYKVEMLETEEKDAIGELHNFRNSYVGMIKNDELHAIWGIQMDITNQRRLEEQLRQSQKLEAIGTLAGGIAHDFNNLLTVINGHAEISLMNLESEHPSHRDIISILNAGKRAKNLTSQLLAFSRKQIYNPKIIEINQAITGLDKMLRRLIGEDISIETNLRENIPAIKADPGQIEQILINLIVNARDAINEKGAATLEKKIIIETNNTDLDQSFVEKHTGSSSGPHVVITVSDTGIGMDEETCEKIFEPFFTTKDKGLGTGLGMSTVYGIVKQNKGSIYAYSEPGHGSTMKIYWPSSNEKPIPEETQVLEKNALLGNESILVVEDDEGVRNFVSTALTELGYTIQQAVNGKLALELLKKENMKVDLVITDLIMPEMNGKELAVELEKIFPDIHILFTSGYTEDHIVKSGSLDKGINFLQKPYSLQLLAKKVREVIGAKP